MRRGHVGRRLAAVWALWAIANVDAQTVLRVNGGLAAGGDNGTTWADAFRGPEALQRALDAAAPLTMSGQTVQLWVAAGVYHPTEAALPGQPGSETFRLTSHLEVYGGFAGTESSLDQRDIDANPVVLSGTLGAGHAWHVVTMRSVDSTCIVDGVSITGGSYNWSPGLPNEGGGGMLIVSGSPLVRFCTILENTMTSGGNTARGAGVWTSGGTPHFEDCRFSANRGGQGGALCGDAFLLRCVFGSNTASGISGDGGAVSGNCTVVSCYFGNQYAKFAGGAISGSGTIVDTVFESNGADGGGALAYGPFTVSRCTIRNNYANWDSVGGVAYLSGSSLNTFTDCEFVQNGATYGGVFSGGAISLNGCRFRGNSGTSLMYLGGPAVNCVFTGNSGPVRVGAGAALVNCTFLNTGGPALQIFGTDTVRVSNCVFWGGSAPAIDQGSGHLLLNFSCVQGLIGSGGGVGNFSADPRLDADGRLLSPSPCIDAGDSAAVPAGATTDAFGQPRFADDPGMPNNGAGSPPVDIGAFEFQGVSCYPNCDGSAAAPILNVADFGCLLQAFASSSPYANCDASTVAPVLNVADFTCFMAKFGAGCP
jgi:hypothetical protein